MNYLAISLLSWLFFTVLASLYFLNEHFSFNFYLVSFGVVSLPAIVFFGIISSKSIDFLVKKKMKLNWGIKYNIVRMLLFLLFGMASSILVLAIFDLNFVTDPFFLLLFAVLGILAALIFYFIELILTLINMKNNANKI